MGHPLKILYPVYSGVACSSGTAHQDFGALEEDDEINDANDETFGDMAMPTGIGTLEELSMNTHARLGPIESMQPAAGTFVR